MKPLPAVLGPDPIGIHGLIRHRCAAAVPPAPADGVEDKSSVRAESIMRRLSADDVVGNFSQKLRNEGIESHGVFTMRQMITCEGAGHESMVELRLIERSRLASPDKSRQTQNGKKGKGRSRLAQQARLQWLRQAAKRLRIPRAGARESFPGLDCFDPVIRNIHLPINPRRGQKGSNSIKY
jgi:hypothetical protein